MKRSIGLSIVLLTLLTACNVGPNYMRPAISLPESFKEVPEGWKIAQPKDGCPRGPWWTIFNEPELNELEAQLNINNQNILAAISQYEQAKALVLQARSAYFPVVAGSATTTREKQSRSNFSVGSVSSPTGSAGTNQSSLAPFNLYNLTLDATWAPDLWGSIRRSVASAVDTAQADAAQVVLTKLLAEASLAQYYFQIRGLDADQKILDDTVKDYNKILQITLSQYQAGTASRLNVAQAQSALEAAQASAIDNGINRAIYEHAMAVLIGVPPSCFSYASNPLVAKDFSIPVDVPSEWLERRPDVAQAERMMAAANEEIGVAISAYFPTLTLSGTDGYQANFLRSLFKKPAHFWSIAAQVADTLFDGGLRSAKVDQAREVYNQAVATYKQTILTAFQDVEDNLASVRILENEEKILQQGLESAELALKIALNQYKAGTVQLSDVLTIEIAALTARKSLSDVLTRRMVASALLVKALGGGWDENKLPTYGCCTCDNE